MAADSALKIAENQANRFGDSAPASSRMAVDNDNHAGAVLTQKEIHPLALEGAKRLISRHTAKTPVVIKSWGSPDVVYAQISKSLIDFGYEISMAEDIAEKLVDHAVEHAETSRAKYAANIIALKIEVSKAKPLPQFETGALESQRIDGLTRQAQVAGATSVSMGINTGGTTVTALRDSVGEIMDAMAGASQAVWIDFEAPDKSELEGVANDAALSAMAQIAGGGLAPEQVEELLAEMQVLVEAGLIAPEILSAMQNLQQIQIMAAEGNFDGIKELSQSIIEDLAAALEAGETSPDIIAAAVNALEVIAEAHGLETVIDVKAVNTLKQDVQVAQLTEKLEIIAADLNGADQATLTELIEQLGEVEGADLMAHLDVIQQQLETMGIDAAQLTEIKADISALKDTVIQNLPLEQKLEIVAELGAQELLTLLQELDGAEGLPAELAEVIEKLDVENLSVEELKEALAGKGDPAIAELVQQTVLAMGSPDVQVQLPQAALNQVNAFLSAQPVLVDAVAAQAVVTTLNAAITEMNLPATEAAKIQQVVERLEAGESIDTVDPSIVEAVADKLEGDAPSVKDDNSVPGVEAVTEGHEADAPSETEDGISTPETAADGVEGDAPSKTEDGISTPETVADGVEGDAPSKLEEAVSVIKKSQADNVVVGTDVVKLDEGTVLNLKAMEHSEVIPAKVKEEIAAVLKAPNDIEALKAVQKSLGDNTPPAITEAVSRVTLIQNGGTPVTVKPEFPVTAVTQSLTLMAQQAKQSGSPAQAELLKASAKIIQKFEGTGQKPTVKEVVTAVQKINETIHRNNTSGEKITPAQQAELLKIKEKLVEALPADIKDDLKPQTEQRFTDNEAGRVVVQEPSKPEEIKFESPCDGCGGGKCPGCGTDFGDAVIQAEGEGFGEKLFADIEITEITVEEPIKSEEIKFESPCDGCSGGKCPGCGTDFGEAVLQAEGEGFGEKLFSDNDNDKDSSSKKIVSLEEKRNSATGENTNSETAEATNKAPKAKAPAPAAR